MNHMCGVWNNLDMVDRTLLPFWVSQGLLWATMTYDHVLVQNGAVFGFVPTFNREGVETSFCATSIRQLRATYVVEPA